MNLSTTLESPGSLIRKCLHQPISDGNCTLCHDLSKVETRLAAAQRCLTKLTVAQCDIKSEMNRTSDTLLKAFPMEIISQIFELALEPYGFHKPHLEGYSDPLNTFSPLSLCAVCRAWRNIASSTPTLWTYIPIRLDAKIFATPDGYEMAERWFRRSGSYLPLFIRVHETANNSFKIQFLHNNQRLVQTGLTAKGCPSMSQMSALMNLINKYSHRVQFLDIQLPGFLLEKITKQTNGTTGDFHPPAPIEVLRIHNTDLHRTGSCTMDLSGYPAPKQLRLLDVRINSMQGIKWAHLSNLFLKKAYTDELLFIILHAPSLQSCRFDEVQYRMDADFSAVRRPCVHGSLLKLVFCTESPEVIEFFDKVTTPTLVWLAVIVTPMRREVSTDSVVTCLKEFLERSQFKLVNFCLELPALSLASSLWQLLYTLPASLETLQLGRSFRPELWTELFVQFGRPCRAIGGRVLFPNLCDIRFCYANLGIPSPPQWGVIADTLYLALSGRNDPFVKNLKYVVVSLRSAPSLVNREPPSFQMTYRDLGRFAELIRKDRVPFCVLGSTGYMNHPYQVLNLLSVHDYFGLKPNPYDLCTIHLRYPPNTPMFR